MHGRYARLKKDSCLRGWTDLPWAIVNWITADVFELTKKSFYVAAACDGRTNFNSLAFLPEHLAVLDALIQEGVAEACQAGDVIEPWQRHRVADNPLLRVLHWCVTGLCNLNCRHCYMQSPSGRYGELPFEEMVRLVQQFERANVVQVSLTGGEPFLRKDLLDIMAVLAQKRIWVSQIYSNGLLITEGILDKIKEIGCFPRFQISFDGYGRHDDMRGREGIERRAIDAIRRVRAAGFPVIVAGNVDRTNVGRLGETYDLLRGLDIQAWRLGVPIAAGNWKGTTTSLSIDEEAVAYPPLLDRWLRDGRPFELVLGQFLRAAANGSPPVDAGARILHTPERYDCGSCRENPNLLPDGTLLPCPGYVDTALQPQMPNIVVEGLSKVWTESLLRSLAEMKKSDVLACNEVCARCELFGHCGAGCRASALREVGNLMARDPIACTLWKAGYKQRFHDVAAAPLA